MQISQGDFVWSDGKITRADYKTLRGGWLGRALGYLPHPKWKGHLLFSGPLYNLGDWCINTPMRVELVDLEMIADLIKQNDPALGYAGIKEFITELTLWILAREKKCL